MNADPIKRTQEFIHKYYDSIKLFLMMAILGLVAYGLFYQIDQRADDLADRQVAVQTIVQGQKNETDEIKKELSRQSDIINRQFTALCIIIIDTSGTQSLDKLDPDTRARCQRLADNPKFIKPIDLQPPKE